MSETPDVTPRGRGIFLRNLAEFQTELARVAAGFIPVLADWETRKEMPMLVFRDLRRVQELRARQKELGVAPGAVHLSRGVPARGLIEQLCSAPDTATMLRAVYGLVKPTLLAALDAHLAALRGVFDLPSVPVLEANREELARQIEWGRVAVLRAADASDAVADEAFLAGIGARCAGLPAALSKAAPEGSVERVTRGRKLGRLPLADATLPRGFRSLEFGPEALPRENTYAQRERYHAVNFLQEVQATDSCASLLFDTPDLPWEFYFDCARHMWDESRHAMFGEQKLAALGTTAAEAGLSTKAYLMRQTLAPLDRYAALTTQEADAFPGKHVGLKDAVAHGDQLSAMAWSYDISDETQHVRYGSKWLPVMIEQLNEARDLEQVRADACTWRVAVLAEVYKPAAAMLR